MGVTSDWLIQKANEHLQGPHGTKHVLTANDKAVLNAIADLYDETSRQRAEQVQSIRSRLSAIENRGDSA